MNQIKPEILVKNINVFIFKNITIITCDSAMFSPCIICVDHVYLSVLISVEPIKHKYEVLFVVVTQSFLMMLYWDKVLTRLAAADVLLRAP